MDPESPIINRVERTFWTVWSFITGAVNRLLRSEPGNTDSKDSNCLQESTVDGELAECSHEGGEANIREVDEEQPVTTTSLLSSSQPAVAWELCTTEIDLGRDENSKRFETKKESERDEDTKEEEVSKMGNDKSGLILKDEEKKDDLLTLEQDDMPKNEKSDECLEMRSQIHMDDAMGENLSCAKGEAEWEMSLNVQQIMEETQPRIQYKVEDDEHDVVADDNQKKSCTITEKASMHIEELSVQKNETDLLKKHEEVESSDGVLMPASEKEMESGVGAVQVEKQLSAQEKISNDDLLVAYNKSITVHEDELVAIGKEHVMTPRNESEKSEDVKEEDERSMDKNDLAAVIQEEDETKTENNQALREVLEQEENSQEVPEDNNSNDQIIEFVLNVQIEPLTNEKQEEVAKDTSVQTRLTETDCRETESYDTLINTNVGVTSSDYSAFERFLDEYEEQEDIKESNFREAHTASSVTVKPDIETGQEQSGELKKTPEGILEGHSVVSEELNPPSCEEVQEGVPEHNNEPGPDENTTQRFLEVGDSKEVQTTQLPEEVESRETGSLQNSGCSAEVDCLLVQEHMKDTQEKKETSKSNFDLVGAGLTQEPVEPIIEQLLQEKGPFSAEEDRKSMVTSMTTGIEPAEKESVSDFGFTNEKDLQNEELLVEMAEGPSKEADAARDGFLAMEKMLVEETLKLLEAEEQNTTETSLLELADTVNLEPKINRTSNLLEDISENVQTKPKSLEDIELQDAGKCLEVAGLKVEEDADCGMQKSEVGNFDLQVAEMAPAITKEMSALISELALTKDAKSQEMKNQLSDFQETPDSEIMESKPKDVTMISTEEMLKHVVESEVTHGEETVCSGSGSPDHIDEEILDLWMETLSKDDEKHQKGTELGLQIRTDVELAKEEQREVEDEQLVESNSGEYELVSDAEMSSSTAESGFSDQSLSELGTQNSEEQLLRSTHTGPIHGTYDMLVNASESGDISGQQVEQQNSVSEETADVEQSYLKDEGSVAGYNLEERGLGVMSQEWDQTQEKSHESHREIDEEETDLSRKADFKITEDMSLTEDPQEALIKVESLDITPPEAKEDILQTESSQSPSSSDASSEEGILLAEFGPGDVTLAQSDETSLKLPSLEKMQLGWSEDKTDLVPGPNRAEVEEQLKLESEDQTELDTSVLDFSAQRSRIAVKNPHVRPPKDPRSLLLMPSVDPTPAPVKVPAGVPLGGMGIGIKLPGLGAGFPVLKKTQHVLKDENSSEDNSQEPETEKEEKSDSTKQDETQHRPKWMPPKHPGFGNPLMSELKTKLKKTTKD
ncbi:uncharacterized protein si:ch211-136m16.8 [Cheilinus undulatus]|uniref:uncharacterized protein si:ch211-136m16.8 n=1 Tax=Cheilinus undulatus TaxID=241271 RepID=UPI001BD580D2|nr:uncharacterized protein si:ch211-136m16.8 [Cheilinus undulatus]